MVKLISVCCSYCNKIFDIKNHSLYYKKFKKNSSYKLYCSHECRRIDRVPSEVFAEYESGKSSNELGKKYGVPGYAIIDALKSYGVKIRSKSEWLLTDNNPTKGKGHSAEAKKKISDAAIRQFSDPKAGQKVAEQQSQRIADGLYSRTSKLEIIMAKEFDKFNIEYKKHKAIAAKTDIGFCYPDFVIGKAAIEVNGTFWHSDPRKYPNGPKFATQIHNMERYQRKLKILEENDLSLVEIWEIDIEKDLVSAFKECLSKINKINGE